MNEIKNTLKAYMDDLAKSNHFNGAVSVIYKDEVLLQDAYGISSYQYDIPIRKDTKFRIGSLTKAFTAMAILILHEKGKVGLHDTIDPYFPDFPHGKRVTIHHLLTNTSGIYNFTDSPNYWETTMRKQASIQDILVSISELPLNFEPGEKMEYSNTGYLFLTAIIEKVSGLSYADFLESNILSKLALTNTGVDNGRTIVKDLATGYTAWEEIIQSEFVDMSFPLGAYGMYSSVADLQKWAIALRNHQLIREDLQKLMFSSFGNGYGYGWFMDSKENRASHFGDINGFVSNFVLDLQHDITVIVLSNINICPVDKITADILNIIQKNYQPQELSFWGKDPHNVKKYVGTYSNNGNSIEICYNQRLYAIVPKMYGVRYKLRLFPYANDQFFSDIIREKYIFLEDGRLEYEDCYGKKSIFSRV